MKYILVLVLLAISFVLKVSEVAGAEAESSGKPVDKPTLAMSDVSDDSVMVVPSGKGTVAAEIQKENSATLSYEDRDSGNWNHQSRASLTPMIGGTGYATRWNEHIGNSYTFGLALDVPLNGYLSAEIEGSYGRFDISYLSLIHNFNQYTMGGSLKVSPLAHKIFHPYAGAGMLAVDYDNMLGFHDGIYGPYNQWIGSLQGFLGCDASVTQELALGIRGSYVIPVINRPTTLDNGYSSAPGYEEAAAINTSFYRVMGTVRVSF